jgi:hypothetical protein
MLFELTGSLDGKRVGVYDLDGCVVDSSGRLRSCVNTQALTAGDLTSYTHSFYNYGKTCEGDVLIENGVKLVYALSQIYNVDVLVALTSRGQCGRAATESWLEENLPWQTGGELLVMHRERHFGRGAESLDSVVNKNQWGYSPALSGRSVDEARWDGDMWYLDVLPGELFSPEKYKEAAIKNLQKRCEVLFAVDDHPGIIEMYDGMGFDSFRCVWDSVDCLTPAGDPRVL